MRFLAFVAAVLSVRAQSAPNAAQILRRMGDVYNNSKQYQFAIKQTGEETASQKIAVIKPNRFHFETDGDVADGDERYGLVTMISDGSTAWNYVAGLKQYTQKNTSLPLTDDVEPPEVTPEAFVYEAETAFITRFARFANSGDHAKLLREESLPLGGRSVACYVVELDAPLPGFRDTYTLWLDKSKFLVLREDTKPDSQRRRPSSLIFSIASIDEPLPEDLFHFTPPRGAKQVEHFE